MRGRFRRRTQDEADRGAALAARPGPPAEEPEEPPGPGTPGRKQGATCPVYNSDKVYLGVRVKMPVRDLLRNIRLSRGGPPLEAQRKEASQGLEELAFIVEVLEEDLRASSHPPQSPNWSPLGPAGSAGEELDEMIPSPGSSWTRSPGPPWCPVWAEPPGPDRSPDGSCFFWTQLQKEESVLAGVADAALLRTDGRGRTYLHQVACVGKRALGYCIAKRMAALHGLDLRDSAGMVMRQVPRRPGPTRSAANGYPPPPPPADRPPLRRHAQPPPDGGRFDPPGSRRQRQEPLGEVLPPPQRRERLRPRPGGPQTGDGERRLRGRGSCRQLWHERPPVRRGGLEGRRRGPGGGPAPQTPRPPPGADDGDAGVPPADGRLPAHHEEAAPHQLTRPPHTLDPTVTFRVGSGRNLWWRSPKFRPLTSSIRVRR
ncbi:unnamed protein product [Tetraodon nigroviridis]|uniref:(spotted green pufferfish) hypothetical protein n=1 Tax=Tetraodon nigroviridis TaxID=99883 RepID=Q4RYQ5_TETNG|nr:unnamed protein product [Tetraodon nigroviridis]